MNSTKWLIITVIVVVGGILYYGISPLFNIVEVQDELPENITLENGLTGDMQADMERQIEEANDEGPIMADEEMPATVSPSPATVATFAVMATAGHPASGTVRVVNTTDGQVIRYENFETINGPNLHVYLAKDLEAREYIDLGPIKGTQGNINYNVPAGTDLSEYRYVMYWCVPFGVLFNYAEISQ